MTAESAITTWGHRHLIETAASRCDALHVFVVEEDRSYFPAEDRLSLIREGTADLPHVRVHLSGRHMISAATLDGVLALCAETGCCALDDFGGAPDTNGKRCFQTYRLPGIRGEAAAGFPSVITIGLPALRRWMAAGLSLNDASLYALLALLAQVSDTNMVRRGGLATAEACRQQAQDLLSRLTPESLVRELFSLDQASISSRTSPRAAALTSLP